MKCPMETGKKEKKSFHVFNTLGFILHKHIFFLAFEAGCVHYNPFSCVKGQTNPKNDESAGGCGPFTTCGLSVFRSRP